MAVTSLDCRASVGCFFALPSIGLRHPLHVLALLLLLQPQCSHSILPLLCFSIVLSLLQFCIISAWQLFPGYAYIQVHYCKVHQSGSRHLLSPQQRMPRCSTSKKRIPNSTICVKDGIYRCNERSNSSEAISNFTVKLTASVDCDKNAESGGPGFFQQ